MKTQNWIHLFFTIALISTYGIIARADDRTTPNPDEHTKHHPAESVKGAGTKAPTPEMRKKMVEMHQMMADCLKSDKPIKECKQEMMKHCPMMKETGHCPMMGEMDKMMGGHGGMGKGPKAEKGQDHEAHHPQE